MDRRAAKQIARNYLNSQARDKDYEAVILDENTLERDRLYVFFYQSRKYLETNDINYSLVGNAPILIEKETGRVVVTGTARDIKYYLENYDKYGTIHPPEGK
ncbi:YrhB domain-containing protein [Myxosarcina sp. GI1]|uniref:YrhB domain-containing protein n=1 Tax=Myxosarcina sp. GI1 TaxID=1541065 RepID=UPI00068E12E3|nr:YrhB domain-containing protein [Myxosarcina sp. GI1]